MSERSVKPPQSLPAVSRIVSLIVLCALVVVIGILFFQVMFRFFLPMFVALVLVVMFRPLHEWYLDKCRQRNYLAAALTTTTILLIVLLPFAFVLYRAAVEVTAQAKNADVRLLDEVNRIRTEFGLDLPPADTEHALVKLGDEVNELARNIVLARDELERSSLQPGRSREPTADSPDAKVETLFSSIDADLKLLRTRLGLAPRLPPASVLDAPPSETWWGASTVRETVNAIDRFDQQEAELRRQYEAFKNLSRATHAAGEILNVDRALEGDPTLLEATPAEPQPVRRAADELSHQLQLLLRAYDDVQTSLVGNELLYQLKQLARLDQVKVDQLLAQVRDWGTPQLISLPQRLGGLIGGVLVGVIVMVISLFYFLADGPGMIRTVMRLSPLDDRYEEQILVEFDRVSRAVVVATLLSAAVQGGLALIGYYIAGLQGIFLLAVLTGLLAMVPFVGAASVWAVCSAWLLFDGQTGQGIFLILYGFFVISMADNVIKPLVLHGQSNLHPLLALLSVLGGVQALGPIGIFVGPMVVAFMQAALTMLRTEVSQISEKPETPNERVAPGTLATTRATPPLGGAKPHADLAGAASSSADDSPTPPAEVKSKA